MYASDPRSGIGDRRRSPRLAAAAAAAANRAGEGSLDVEVDVGTDAWGSMTDNEWDTSSHLNIEAFAESSTSSRADSLHQHEPNQEVTSHPLSRSSPTPPYSDILGDPSRPALHRATSMVERQVAESSRSASDFGGSGSLRGSFDLLRMSALEEGQGQSESAGEVEVLIHTIKPGESLAGIALLYGIDLPTLRKVNKLWASDPIHIRTHLYVPLEACRWNTASETLLRGPGEGQVTLAPNPKTKIKATSTSASGKEKGKGRAKENDIGFWNESSNIANPISLPSPGLGMGVAETFMPSTSTTYERHSNSNTLTDIPSGLLGLGSSSHSSESRNTVQAPAPEIEDDDRTPRVLDVVRIPSSQLRFFPRAKHPRQPSGLSSAQRTSFENHNASSINPDESSTSTKLKAKGRGHLRRSSSETNTQAYHTPSIIHDLSTLPPPLRPPPTHSQADSMPPLGTYTRSKTSNIVKLRPPQSHFSQTSNGNGIANRLSALFTVPPPPPSYPHITSRSRGSTPRLSLDSTYSTPRSSKGGSEAGSPARKHISAKEENISMDFISLSSSRGGGGAPDLGKIKARINNNHKRKED